MLGRTKLEILLGIALLVVGGLFWIESKKVRSPFLPRAVFSVTANSIFMAKGTWRREDNDDALPIQSTSITCDRIAKKCTEATVVIAEDLMLPIQINVLDVERWDEQFIVIRGAGALCTEERYTADVRAETMTGVVSRKVSCQGMDQKPARIRLIDGYLASRALRRSGY